jgi:hypothetical protein
MTAIGSEQFAKRPTDTLHYTFKNVTVFGAAQALYNHLGKKCTKNGTKQNSQKGITYEFGNNKIVRWTKK